MRPRATLAFALAVVPLLLLASIARADGGGGCKVADDEAAQDDHVRATALKIVTFFTIPVCGALGCCLPVLGRQGRLLARQGIRDGVILAIGFIHILPNAFDKLTADCLSGGSWQAFPFTGFGAMVGGAMGTLVVDTVATGYFTRIHLKDSVEAASVTVSGVDIGEEEKQQVSVAVASATAHVNGAAAGGDGHMHVHAHAHATHDHARKGPTYKSVHL